LGPVVEQAAEGVQWRDGTGVAVRLRIGRDVERSEDLEIQWPRAVGDQLKLMVEGVQRYPVELLLEEVDGRRGEEPEVLGRNGACEARRGSVEEEDDLAVALALGESVAQLP